MNPTPSFQSNLAAFVTGHGFEALPQDSGVVILTPVYRPATHNETCPVAPDTNLVYLGDEAQYVETYREARNVLGY